MQVLLEPATNSGSCLSFSPALIINDQPVENRRKKSARRGKGAPLQHGSQKTEASPQDAFSAKAESGR